MTDVFGRLFDSFFFFNDTATTEIYTLSLHDALPISVLSMAPSSGPTIARAAQPLTEPAVSPWTMYRSEEHTSELQSHVNLVCRLLLETKKNPPIIRAMSTGRDWTTLIF